MKYEIDIKDKEIFVKDSQGYWASHKNYDSFTKVLRTFTKPLDQTTSKATLIFTERAQEFFSQEQRKNLSDIVVGAFNK